MTRFKAVPIVFSEAVYRRESKEDEHVLHADVKTLETNLRERIEELETWIAAIADDHPQIPDWIQQSAKSLLARESE